MGPADASTGRAARVSDSGVAPSANGSAFREDDPAAEVQRRARAIVCARGSREGPFDSGIKRIYRCRGGRLLSGEEWETSFAEVYLEGDFLGNGLVLLISEVIVRITEMDCEE